MRAIAQLALLIGLALFQPSSRADEPSSYGGSKSAANSIWPRLVAGMRLGGEQRAEVQHFISHYRSNPQFFSAMLARAEPFLWYVLQAAEARRLPTELALLPAVESSWDPHAVSVSSAYGLWQFIPKTGSAYGLKDALNYDARRDPVASTMAAFDLLAELHGEYGDWPLALAAYNTGGVRVRQAIKQGKSRNFWKLPLPPVTKDYVPRLLAIAALVREPRRYGLTLPSIAASGVAELISLDQNTPLHLAMQAAGVDQAVLRTFNPGLKASNAPTASPTLLLPPADAVVLRAELAQLNQQRTPSNAAAKPDRQAFAGLTGHLHWSHSLGGVSAPSKSPATAQRYTIKGGDTLFSIARKYRLTAPQLQVMNPGVRMNELKPGQTLKVADCASPRCG